MTDQRTELAHHVERKGGTEHQITSSSIIPGNSGCVLGADTQKVPVRLMFRDQTTSMKTIPWEWKIRTQPHGASPQTVIILDDVEK